MKRNLSSPPRHADSVQEAIRLLRLDGNIVELGSNVDQVYSYETDAGWQYHWSIVEATKRAKARGELTSISLSDVGMTQEMVRLMNRSLDEAYALTTDLLKPVLFVPFYPERDDKTSPVQGKVHVLIDGWHRVFHALCIGVDVLPCYVLTEADTDASLVIKLPPGKGLSFDDEDDFCAVLIEGEKRMAS